MKHLKIVEIDAQAGGQCLVQCRHRLHLVGCGHTFRTAISARDRDRMRETVLRHLGWGILCIWSTDWYRSSTAACDRVHSRLCVSKP
ncbi:hypothetical protein [Thiohalocapsa marina]|uniref:hypothetical protein n=1 Tax=Thiohalocapsa marina TaxID=424902 RepID=UPI0036DDCFB2